MYKPTERILKLVHAVGSSEQFIQALKKWPHWYLQTTQEKLLTKRDFEQMYNSYKGRAV